MAPFRRLGPSGGLGTALKLLLGGLRVTLECTPGLLWNSFGTLDGLRVAMHLVRAVEQVWNCSLRVAFGRLLQCTRVWFLELEIASCHNGKSNRGYKSATQEFSFNVQERSKSRVHRTYLSHSRIGRLNLHALYTQEALEGFAGICDDV